MEIINQEAWEEGLAANTDPYGACVYRYAERWADLLEQGINNGQRLADIAEQTSHQADTEDITGFMYGAAVSILAQCWKYGEELRQWHNLDVQIGNEGEKANAGRGVLNPALLSIRCPPCES